MGWIHLDPNYVVVGLFVLFGPLGVYAVCRHLYEAGYNAGYEDLAHNRPHRYQHVQPNRRG